MQLVIAAAGAAVGFMVGGPMGASIGWALGSALGGSMAPATKVNQTQALMDLTVTGAAYGQAIPYLRGAVTVAGQVWWNTDRIPTTNTSTTSTGGKGGGGGTQTTTTTITYSIDMLIGLSDNPIVGVSRIWLNGGLVWTNDVNASGESLAASAATSLWNRLTVYTGADDQLPDPTYEAAVGVGAAPAYRGRGSVFIEGLQLGQSGQVPNLTFEVIVDGSLTNNTINCGLSGPDELIATYTGPGVYMGATLTQFASTGKHQAETVFTTGGDNAQRVGLCDSTFAIATGIGNDAHSYAWDVHYPCTMRAGTIAAYGSLVAPGAVIGTLWDADLGTLRWTINGVDQGVAFTGVFGSYAFSIEGDHTEGNCTTNIGDTPFAYPQAGYGGWTGAAATLLKGPPSVSDVVSGLCTRAGLASGEFDVTGLASITRPVRCMAVSQVVDMRSVLELLMSAYYFEMTVSDKIYFRARGGASVATLPYLDLGASKGTDSPEPLALLQANELEIPAQVALTYINIEDDYQPDTQYSDRLVSAAWGTVNAINMALGMSPDEAKAVADTILLDTATSVISTTIAVLGDYCALEATDVVTLTGEDGSSFRVRLVQKTDSYPLLTFDTVLDDASALLETGITSADYTSSTVVVPLSATLMQLMDVPILQDADNDPGFYVATKGTSGIYPGSAVFNSVDDVTFVQKAIVAESAVFGACTTTLGDWTGGRVFDEKNSVTVNVGSGSLASTTRDNVLNSVAVNAMLIGSEMIQFRTANLTAPGIYVLSGLLRGGRGTEWAMTGHAASERCVLLQANGLRRVAMLTTDLGLPRYYKGVTLGQGLSSASAVTFTDNAIGLKPFSPILFKAGRDASHNIVFEWQRRTRLAVRMIGPLGISAPLGEGTESYQTDIFSDSSYSTVVRTIASSTPTASYTAAQQSADGLTPGNTIYARVYQLSATVGRGYPLQQAA